MIYLPLIPIMALARRLMGGPVSKNWGRGLSFVAGFLAAWTDLPWWVAVLIGALGPIHFTIDHAGDWTNAWNEKMRYSGAVLVGVMIIAFALVASSLAGVESISVWQILAPLALVPSGVLSAGSYWLAGRYQDRLNAIGNRWMLPNGSYLIDGYASFAEFATGAAWGLCVYVCMITASPWGKK